MVQKGAWVPPPLKKDWDPYYTTASKCHKNNTKQYKNNTKQYKNNKKQ
jgi:hypothetical protein